tara:strand:+ start:422 stop:607 length:186 start_codon:yes stop_codon:yes gene_type:complete
MDKDGEALKYIEGYKEGAETVKPVVAKLILKYMALGRISVVDATQFIKWCIAELKEEIEND